MRFVLCLLILLAGCTEPPAAMTGPCEPADLLLVQSSASNMPTPEPSAPRWIVVWPDAEVWRLGVDLDMVPGTFNASTVQAAAPLHLQEACGIVSFHGTFPGSANAPWWMDSLGDSWEQHYSVALLEVRQRDLVALQAIIEDGFFALPADASVPDCADGGTVAYTAKLQGATHQSKASCQWTEDFGAFHDAFQAWLAGTE